MKAIDAENSIVIVWGGGGGGDNRYYHFPVIRLEGTSKLDNLLDHVREYCYEVDGWIMPKLMPREYLDDLKNFQVRSDDTFLVTWPKSGKPRPQTIG